MLRRKKQLSLDEAVQLGIQNSKSLKIDAAKIEEATADLLEAKKQTASGIEGFGELYVSSD